ncbi:MAG: hypothetical protein K6G90_10650 [Clostridia bacterium]|nr:hypothetical protein [Clostridia bacterium]
MNSDEKTISLLLSFILLISGCACAAYASEDYSLSLRTPMIMIHGTSNTVYDTPEGEVALYDDGEYISKLIPDGIPMLAKGLLTGCWDDWTTLFLETMAPAYEHYAPALDGAVPEGSHSNLYNPDNDGYSWNYWPYERMSPLDTADEIAELIDELRASTGCEKVVVIGRCEGSAYATAYVDKYERPRNYSGLKAFILSDPAMNGVHYVEGIFSGNVYIDGTDLQNFIKSEATLKNLLGPDAGETIELIMKAADILKNTYGIELTAAVVNRMYRQLKDPLFAPFLRMYYARGLGAWSTVYQRFDEAVEYLFPTDELKEEYSYFIDKASAFREVAASLPEMVSGMQDAGVVFADIVEYGFPMYPLSKDACEVGDNLTGVRYKGFGAECSRLDGALSEKYITERTEAGFGAYVSPDRQIDASTGLFPDNTWYVKNVNHAIPDQIYAMYDALGNDDITDVFADERYPQFLNYDPAEPTFLPATEADAAVEPIQYNFIEKIKNFFRAVTERIRAIIESIADAIR